MGDKPRIKRVHTKKEFSWVKLLLNLLAIISGVAVFIGFVFLQDFLSDTVTYKTVVVATKEIPKDTTITEENVGTFFEVKEMDSRYLPKDVITELSQITPSKTRGSFVTGEMAIQKDFANISAYSSKVKEPTLISVQVGNIALASSGKIRTGDIVNVYLYAGEHNMDKFEQEEKQGNYVTLLKNAYVLKAMNADGNEIATTDTTSNATLFLFEIEQANQMDFLNKMAMGSEIIVSKVNIEQFALPGEEETEDSEPSKEPATSVPEESASEEQKGITESLEEMESQENEEESLEEDVLEEDLQEEDASKEESVKEETEKSESSSEQKDTEVTPLKESILPKTEQKNPVATESNSQ